MAGSNYSVVAAIDFGTTFSGYGFSTRSKPNDIMLPTNWGAEVGQQSYKTPTSLLVDNNGKFQAFGFEAENRYTDSLSPDENADDNEVVENSENDDEGDVNVEDIHLFKQFKMDLHKQEKLDGEVTVTATDGKFTLPAVKVFGMALGYLKDHLMQAINKQLAEPIKLKDIRWVLTVPAIWTESAKMFMKDAAVKGGLVSERTSENLFIALEPEAASLHCRNKDVSFVVDNEEFKKENLGKGDCYMVVDAGGGTMDITVHEIQDGGVVKELTKASGGPWGGIYVDKQLSYLFDEVFGSDVMIKFKETHPNHWMTMMLDWEVRKRAATGAKTVNLQVNTVFADFVKARNTDAKDIRLILLDKPKCGIRYGNGIMKISSEKCMAMFDAVIDPTIEHLKSLVMRPNMKNMKCIFIVGGFGEAKILQAKINSALSSNARMVLIPNDASLCVIKGAILFGHNPHVISTRVASRTYCFETTRPYREGDDKNLIIKTENAKDEKRIRYLRTLVKMNDDIKAGVIREITTKPVKPNQTSLKFKICMADKEDVMDPKDKDVQELGEIVVPLPSASKTANREVQLKLHFGGTSITATALHKATSKEVVADFQRLDV